VNKAIQPKGATKMFQMLSSLTPVFDGLADAKRLKNPISLHYAVLDLGAWGIFPNKQIIGLRAQ